LAVQKFWAELEDNVRNRNFYPLAAWERGKFSFEGMSYQKGGENTRFSRVGDVKI